MTSGPSNACSPAYGTSRSACTPRASRTRRPAAAAYDAASASRTVLPIPGSPTTTRTADRPELAASTAAAHPLALLLAADHAPHPRSSGAPGCRGFAGRDPGSVAARLGSPQPPRKEVRHEASARRRHRRPRPGGRRGHGGPGRRRACVATQVTGRRVGGDGRSGGDAGRRPAAVREHPRLQLRPRRQRDHQPSREPAGLGRWRKTGAQTYGTSWWKYRFDATGAFVGKTVVTEQIEMMGEDDYSAPRSPASSTRAVPSSRSSPPRRAVTGWARSGSWLGGWRRQDATRLAGRSAQPAAGLPARRMLRRPGAGRRRLATAAGTTARPPRRSRPGCTSTSWSSACRSSRS